ncbi:MAG: phospholipase D-like domain-containing protein [Blastocatellia bacterium]
MTVSIGINDLRHLVALCGNVVGASALAQMILASASGQGVKDWPSDIPIGSRSAIREILIRCEVIEPHSNNCFKINGAALNALPSITHDLLLAANLCKNNRYDYIDQVSLVWTLPADLVDPSIDTLPLAPNMIESLIMSLIRSANYSLTILTPFFDPVAADAVGTALAGSLKRGCKVLFATQELDVPNSSNVAGVKKLLSIAHKHTAPLDNCHIVSARKEWSKRLLHAKIIVADHNRAYLGTANLTWAGLQKHFEIGIEIQGTEAQQIEELALWVCDRCSIEYNNSI